MSMQDKLRAALIGDMARQKNFTPGEYERGAAIVRLLVLESQKKDFTGDAKVWANEYFDALKTCMGEPEVAVKTIHELLTMVLGVDALLAHIVKDITGEEIDMLALLTEVYAHMDPSFDDAAD